MNVQLKSHVLRDLRLHRGLVLRFLQLNNDVSQLYQVVGHLRRILENCEDELAELIPLADYRMREALYEIQQIIKSHFDYLKRNFRLHAINLEERKKAEDYFLKHLRKKLHRLRIFLWHLKLLEQQEIYQEEAEEQEEVEALEEERERQGLRLEEEEEARETRMLVRRLLRTTPQEIRQMAEQLQQEIQTQYERFIGEFHELTREATQVIELANQLPERLNQELLRLQHILGQEYQHIQHTLSETYNLVQHASHHVDEIRHFMHHLLRQVAEKYQELLRYTLEDDQLFRDRLEYIERQREGQHHLHPTFYHPVSHFTYLTSIQPRLRQQQSSLDEQRTQSVAPSFQHLQRDDSDKRE